LSTRRRVAELYSVSARLLINHPKEIKFKKTLDKVTLPVSIEAAREILHPLCTSILVVAAILG